MRAATLSGRAERLRDAVAEQEERVGECLSLVENNNLLLTALPAEEAVNACDDEISGTLQRPEAVQGPPDSPRLASSRHALGAGTPRPRWA